MVKKERFFSTEGIAQSDRSIHTPGAFARQNLLYVQEVGRLQSLQPHKCVRENLDSWLFMVVLKGKGSLDIKGKHYELVQGDCALIDCKEHYEHISDGQDAWNLAWVHFNGHGAKGYYELFIKCNGNENVIRGGDASGWDGVIGELLAAQKERSFQAELHCGELLLGLLNRIIDSVSDGAVLNSEQEKQAIEELREYLNEQFAERDILALLEKNFGEDLKPLGKSFLNKFGISVEEYISSRRFNAAKELLRFSIKPVEKVAKEAGIGDMIVMQQMFRENEGMTAEEYRAKWAQWVR
ncbi:MAG: helix-turn-helix domain-containing protein [Lachnospiraceae bacterium]|nr:helix-turn-helix transcriptional regulator [uncultured Acetatifactor sp.]MCI9218150.1 helix-turn-helix domain-containing protein [Lachnospiraceae bacterium]